MKLPDGTVIPSYMGIESRSNTSPNMALNDSVLRQGEIKKIVYPQDPTSYSKKFIEYEVDVSYRDGSNSYTTARYRGVQANNLFGGVADQFWSTYRADAAPDTYSSSGIGNGSLVYILCVGGSQRFGVIIGGARNPESAPDQQSEGHHLYFEFNGVQVQIKDDGELELVWKGKTKSNGELSDDAIPEAEGTKIQINKQGNVLIATPDEAQYIKLDNENHKLEILGDTEWNVNVNGSTNIVTQDVTTITSHDQTTLNADNNIYMRSAGVLVGDATDYWMLGTTYRNGESQLNSQLKSYLQTLGKMSDDVAQGFAKGVPKLGAVGTLPDAVAEIGKALAIWNTMGSVFNQMANAIQTFEAQAPRYLSPKNKTD